jgi:hypothetical protein
LCEKPLTNNLLSSIEAKKICKKMNCKLLINYNRRVDSNIKIILKAINKQKNFAKVYYSKDTITNGCHFINLFQLLFGNFVKIKNNKRLKRKTYIGHNFLLQFEFKNVNVNVSNKLSNTYSIKNKKFNIKCDYKFFKNFR